MASGEKDQGIWKEFSQNTTIHGLNKVAEENGFTFRRLFWMTLILGGTALFAYQVVERSLYYFKHPVSVNYKFVYQNEVPFPTVTICNQNIFKLSKAVDSNLHEVITSIFSKSKSKTKFNETYSQWTEILGNASKLRTDEVWRLLAHSKHDMIYSCRWLNEPCSSSNFTIALTDHGVCFQFNAAHAHTQLPFKVTQSGSQQGLSLVVNVEQYEYMAGPHDSLGLKILLHDHSHVAMVRDLGEALPTGSHAFVAVTLSQIHNLKPPYGDCKDNVTLQFYDTFSRANCQRDCETSALVEQCGCRDAYMPSYPEGDPRVCTIKEYVNCVRTDTKPYKDDGNAVCTSQCPIPCETTSYKSSTTFSTAFETYADDIEREDYWNRIRKNFIRAREISQKVERSPRKTELEILSRLEAEWKVVTDVIQKVRQTVDRSRAIKAQLLKEMEPRIKFHLFWGLEKIKFVVDNDYIRIWDVIQERTAAYTTIGFYQMTHLYRLMVDDFLAQPGVTAEKVATYTATMRDLDVRLELSLSTQVNLSHVCAAYENGTLQWKYYTTPKRYFDYDYISQGLIDEIIRHNEHTRERYCDKWGGYLVLYVGYIRKLKAMAQQLLYKNTINKTEMEDVLLNFEHKSRIYLYYRYLLFTRVFKPSSNIAEENIKTFTKLVQRFHETMYNLEFTKTNIVILVEAFNQSVWQPLSAAIRKTIANIKDEEGQKYKVATLMTSKQVEEYIQASETFFKDLRTRGLQLSDAWRHVYPAYSNIWQSMLNERPLVDFYLAINREVLASLNDSKHMTKMAPILSEMAGVTEQNFTILTKDEMYILLNADISEITPSVFTNSFKVRIQNITQQTDISFIIGEQMDSFISALTDVQSDFRGFIQSTKVDNEFYRDNFVKVNIFMKDLYLEDMESNEAYSLIALLSDIGGSMGLFIGGSVLTILEVLDIFVIACVKKSTT